MTRRINNKSKMVKAVSVVLSIYMVLSPMAVYASELEEAENNLSAATEERDEAASCVEAAVENAVVSEAQTEFESIAAGVDTSDIPSANTLSDTSALIEEEISRIGNEAIQEAADAIVGVDMSNVDDALDKVSEIVDNVLTDEAVADEVEATADALIAVYDAQAEAALGALLVISQQSDAVTVLEDGSVTVDWTKATKEVQDLYEVYQKSLTAIADAELAKSQAEEAKSQAALKHEAASSKVNELSKGLTEDNKDINEKITESKQDKNKAINSIIDSFAENNRKSLTNKYTVDDKMKDSDDIYRFYVNKVENGIAYGCLTYYDSVNKTILRKNFYISVKD